MEFEPIYREEAKQRMRAGTPCSIGAGGLTRAYMARDSGAGGNSVMRVLCIREHDPARFEVLKKLAQRGGDYENGGGPGAG